MKKNILGVGSLAALLLLLNACGGAPATSNANKAATPTAAKTTASPAAAKKAEPKTEVKNETKPADAKTKNVPNKVATPKDWIYYYDDVKGYGFSLPEGSKGDNQTEDGVDIFTASTPSDIGVVVFAWKDKKASKEDLMDEAIRTMKEDWGETVTAGKLEGESDDYAVAEAASTDPEGKKYKMKILVGTDVTDNYVMFVYTDEDKYAANKAIVDEIWGSFEMYSGGASAN